MFLRGFWEKTPGYELTFLENDETLGYAMMGPWLRGTLPPKMLSWNILGKTTKKMAGHRNRLVPDVVERINPDVLLLQETSTMTLVNSIRAHERDYSKVTEENHNQESQVLYDKRIYKAINNREELFHQDRGDTISLMQVFTESTNLEFREERVQLGGRGRGERARGERAREERARDIINARVSIVGLKRRQDIIPNPIVIFMSFHNINSNDSARVAQGFINMVTTISDMTRCVVVAGADLNHYLEPPLPPTVPQYEKTQWRRNRVIDYFIISYGDYGILVHAHDINEVIEENRQPNQEKNHTAIPHDPLVCTETL